MDKVKMFEEYLSMVGPLTASRASDTPDEIWISILAFLYSDGFIKGFDWTTPAGQVMYGILDQQFKAHENG